MINKIREMLFGRASVAPGSIYLGMSQGIIGAPVYLSPDEAQTHTLITSKDYQMPADYMAARVRHCLDNGIPGVFIIRTRAVLNHFRLNSCLENERHLRYRCANHESPFSISEIAEEKSVAIILALDYAEAEGLGKMMSSISKSLSAILKGEQEWPVNRGDVPNFVFEVEEIDEPRHANAPIPAVWFSQMRALGISMSVYLHERRMKNFDPASIANLNQRVALDPHARLANLDLRVKPSKPNAGESIFVPKRLQIQY